MIIQTNGATPQSSLASSYFTAGTFTPNGAIRGDKALYTTIEPVLATGSTPQYVPDFEDGDQIFAQLGLVDAPATAGTFNAGVLAATVASVSTSGLYPIQTVSANSLATGNTVQIVGSATTPSIDGQYPITVIDSTHFELTGSPVVTASGAGGNIFLLNGTAGSNLIGLAYNISSANLQTPLSGALGQLGLPLCQVSQPENATGVYQINGATNGAIAAGTFWIDSTLLYPQSQWSVLTEQLGSGSSPYVLTLSMNQAPMCFSQFSTPLAAASVTATVSQAGGAAANQIVSVATNAYAGAYTIGATLPAPVAIVSASIANPSVFTCSENHLLPIGNSVSITVANSTITGLADGTYTATILSAATFSVPENVTVTGTATFSVTATCGQASPNMTGNQIGSILANHPYVNFLNRATPNVLITVASPQLYTVQFTGNLGSSTAPTLTVTNNTLIAPTGFLGKLSYNTVQLYAYSRGQASQFQVPFSISRIRASGEQRTIFGPIDFTIYKDNLNYLTAVPVTLPNAVLYNPATNQLVTPSAAAFYAANPPLQNSSAIGLPDADPHINGAYYWPTGSGFLCVSNG